MRQVFEARCGVGPAIIAHGASFLEPRVGWSLYGCIMGQDELFYLRGQSKQVSTCRLRDKTCEDGGAFPFNDAKSAPRSYHKPICHDSPQINSLWPRSAHSYDDDYPLRHVNHDVMTPVYNIPPMFGMITVCEH